MRVKVLTVRRRGMSALTRVRATRRLSSAMATTAATSMTDDSVLATYQRDGYAVRRGILPAADLDPVREFLAAEVDAYARRMLADGTIRSLHAEQPFERRFAAICREMDVSPRSWIGSVFDRVFYDLYRHPSILRVLRELIGPEVVQLGALNIRTKLPEAEITSFPWHQDSHYYNEPSRGKRDGSTEDAHIVTVWVPLVDANVENGCVWVLPGSHRWGLIDAARGEDLNVRATEDVERRGTPTPVEMQVGDVLFLTNLTFHASKMNRTEASRWSVDFRYHAAPETLTGRPRAALQALHDRFRASGRESLTVLSEGPTPTWEEWRDATNRARDQAAAAGR